MPKKLSQPFSVRLTLKERAQLEAEAGDRTLGSYIRSKILAEPEPRRKAKTKRHPVKDHQKLAQALAALGNSRIANNLNQLAHAANSGSLLVTEETSAMLQEACNHVRDMRVAILKALDQQPEASDDPQG